MSMGSRPGSPGLTENFSSTVCSLVKLPSPCASLAFFRRKNWKTDLPDLPGRLPPSGRTLHRRSSNLSPKASSMAASPETMANPLKTCPCNSWSSAWKTAARFGKIARAARRMKMESSASRSSSPACIICRRGPVRIQSRLHPVLRILGPWVSRLSIIQPALTFLPLPQFRLSQANALKPISLCPRNLAIESLAQSPATVRANLSIFKFSIPLESPFRQANDSILQPVPFASLASLQASILFR